MKTTLIALTVLLFGAGGCVRLKAASAENRQMAGTTKKYADMTGVNSILLEDQVSASKYHHPVK